jgi:putative hydrolase of the HAD superfamily
MTSTRRFGASARRFDAVLFDAGGVLVLPDPTVIAPLLAPLGGTLDIPRHQRAHYAAMAAKSHAADGERDWHSYNRAYVRSVGVPEDVEEYAIELLDNTRTALLWRWPVTDTLAAMHRLAAARVPMGVVSNARGQIEAELLRGKVCQVGTGAGVSMRVIVDSEFVGVEKPDPAIFEFALSHFTEFERHRIVYVGDSVTMDVAAARGAGLAAMLLDPYDDHADADFERIESVGRLADEFGVG